MLMLRVGAENVFDSILSVRRSCKYAGLVSMLVSMFELCGNLLGRYSSLEWKWPRVVVVVFGWLCLVVEVVVAVLGYWWTLPTIDRCLAAVVVERVAVVVAVWAPVPPIRPIAVWPTQCAYSLRYLWI